MSVSRDILKNFRVPLGLLDNENRLYIGEKVSSSMHKIQSNLVISNLRISNYRLSRSENLVPV